MKKNLFLSLFFSATMLAAGAVTATPVNVLPGGSYYLRNTDIPRITQLIEDHVSVAEWREVRVQVITGRHNEPHHLLVYLLAKGSHRLEMARMDVDKYFNFISFQSPYKLQAEDINQQPGIKASQAQCPDENVAFIAFAPNDDDLEQKITKGVAKTARARKLPTMSLLLADATRTNYLNYMKCPKLKGNFYDGDANPEEITTVDGVITYEDINTALPNQFNYKVTNIWLACEAYNDPMKSAMLTTAQSQKYAAGINDLLVGPSDRTAACAMKAAINGQPMKASFDSCYEKYDSRSDQWGWGGDGSDIFGT